MKAAIVHNAGHGALPQRLRRLAWRARSSVGRWFERRFERPLGIDTLTLPESPVTRRSAFADSNHYEPLSYRRLREVFSFVPLTQEDVFFDIGAGMGRVVCLAAHLGAGRCVGIEISPELAARARTNAAAFHCSRCARIEIVTCDATAADYVGGTVYFMFNPFGASTLRSVLVKIAESVSRAPRRVRVVWVAPDHRNEDVFQGSSWLRRYAAGRSGRDRLAVTCWTNEGADTL